MLRSIPWDIWLAAGLAITIVFVALFDLAAGSFIVMYGLMCAYVVVQTFKNEIA